MVSNVDWRAIHTYDGSQDAAFEELCAQLARAETPSDAEFIRKDAPDAGVECFCVLSDGSEWGWQAKFFDRLDPPKWSQIDDSIETALDKHPKLVRYYVCVPRNRSDGRVEGQTSALDRWFQHKDKWEGWASNRGMTVEFIWWGASELLERLPAVTGRVEFWFGELHLDESWFQRRFTQAREAAGPRYTQELNVASPTARDLDLFARTEESIDSLKSVARGIRRALGRVERALRDCGQSSDEHSIAKLLEASNRILCEISQVEHSPSRVYPFSQIAADIKEAEDEAERVGEMHLKLADEFEVQNDQSEKSLDHNANTYKESSSLLDSLAYELSRAREVFEHADEVSNSSLLILTGEAGSGKTHLLCDWTYRRLNQRAPTVLLMGQQFRTLSDPWSQTLAQLDVRGSSAEAFVGAIETAAQASSRRAIVIVDALNEGTGHDVWPSHLGSYLTLLQESPWIGVILSIRTPYENRIIPDDVMQAGTHLRHRGFAGQEYESAQAFFDHYGLDFTSVPILDPEFQKPLFLKIICEGLVELGMRRVPRGFHGITQIFELYLKAVNSSLSKRDVLDYDERDNLVKEALEAIALRMTQDDSRWIPRSEARDIVDALLPGREFSRSLYGGMVSNGVLTESLGSSVRRTDEEFVYVTYERFADHLAVDVLLRTHVDPTNPKSAFLQGGDLAFLTVGDSDLASSLLPALCVQVPEFTGNEFFEVAPHILDDPVLRRFAVESFRESIIWRGKRAFDDSSLKLLNQFMTQNMAPVDALDTLLTVSVVPGHRLNAYTLDRVLRGMSMSDRDAWWSIAIHHLWGERRAVDRLVSWASARSCVDEIDNETIDLAAVALSWMLTTSNRFLRDRATKALVALLTGRIAETCRLLERFSNLEAPHADPYVDERLYAVAYGVAMRCHDPRSVERLASLVYELVFASGHPPSHVLLRDYARGVIERSVFLGADAEFDEQLFRPPYQSAWPIIPGDQDLKPLMNRRSKIRFSVMDGDFGRYVIGTNSGKTPWTSWRREDSKGSEVAAKLDLSMVQRYVLWRSFDLGWTEERFEDFDDYLDSSIYGRRYTRRPDKAERIGKKYQWIAYHEIMAYIAEHFQYHDEYLQGDADQRYKGPWQEHLRDIDPSCMVVSTASDSLSAWWKFDLNPDWSDHLEHDEWIARQDDLPSLNDVVSVTCNGENTGWLILDGASRWTEPAAADYDAYDVPRRDISMLYVAYLVQSEDIDALMKWSRDVDFYGRWMPENAALNGMFLGEYGWSEAYRHCHYQNEDWITPGNECPVSVRPFGVEYHVESGFDCSIDEGFGLQLPSYQFVQSMRLRWSGRGADFEDRRGDIVAFDPSAHQDGPSALLVREDVLRDYLVNEKLALFWVVYGEKFAVGGSMTGRLQGGLRTSGLYRLADDGPSGSLRQSV